MHRTLSWRRRVWLAPIIFVLVVAGIVSGLRLGRRSDAGAAAPNTGAGVQGDIGAKSPYSGPVPAEIQTATGFSTWAQVISSGLASLAEGMNGATPGDDSSTTMATWIDGKQVTLRRGPRVTLPQLTLHSGPRVPLTTGSSGPRATPTSSP